MASLDFHAAVKGDLHDWAKRQTKATQSAVASVLRRRVNSGKKGIRTQIAGAKLGKLGLAVRGELKAKDGRDLTKRGDGIDVTGRIYSKALKKNRPGGLVDLITVFDEGATITAGGGKWLAIPGPAVSNKRARPEQFTGRLAFVRFAHLGAAALIFKGHHSGDGALAVAFWLVSKVRLKKRLNVQAVFARTTKGLDALVAREVERRVATAAGKAGIL